VQIADNKSRWRLHAHFFQNLPEPQERAAQIKVLLMDVDGTKTDGGVTLLSQTEEVALEIAGARHDRAFSRPLPQNHSSILNLRSRECCL